MRFDGGDAAVSVRPDLRSAFIGGVLSNTAAEEFRTRGGASVRSMDSKCESSDLRMEGSCAAPRLRGSRFIATGDADMGEAEPDEGASRRIVGDFLSVAAGGGSVNDARANKSGLVLEGVGLAAAPRDFRNDSSGRGAVSAGASSERSSAAGSFVVTACRLGDTALL